MPNYRDAREVREIANELIDEHHAHLHGVRVACVFMDKIPTSKGREVWGRTKKISGLNAFLAHGVGGRNLPNDYSDEPLEFFVIEIAEEAFRRLRLEARRALVDEQLSRCEFEEDEETGALNLAVVGPDVSTFKAVVERHGLWYEDLEQLVRTGAEQLTIEHELGELEKIGATVEVKPASMSRVAQALRFADEAAEKGQ